MEELEDQDVDEYFEFWHSSCPHLERISEFLATDLCPL